MGGAEYQIKCLINKLMTVGEFEINYLARDFNPIFRPEGYTIKRISNNGRLTRFGYFFDTFNLWKSLNTIKPDVIYQRVGCAYTGITALYAKRHGCDLVWHVSSDSDVQPRFQQRCFRASSVPYQIEKTLTEYGLRNCRTIVVQSKDQDDYLGRFYGRSASMIIRNFHPSVGEEIKKSGRIKVVWVANFKHLKHPEIFIRLAADLMKAWEKVNCIMIGAAADWDPAWQLSLEKKIEEVGCLRYLGPLSIEQVNSALSKSHIFVNTSSQEGFANTFIQAWMRKVPVVSLYSNPDNVLEKQGIGFCCGSYENLFRKVLGLLRDSTLRRTMGERAHKYALQAHSERNLETLVDLLRS